MCVFFWDLFCLEDDGNYFTHWLMEAAPQKNLVWIPSADSALNFSI